MALVPLLFEAEGRRVVVVGGGVVGRARAGRMAEAGARVLVVEPRPSPELLSMTPSLVELAAEPFRAAHLEGAAWALACTADAATNTAVVEAGRAAGVPVGRADGALGDGPDGAPGDGPDGGAADFVAASSFRRGDVVVAVSTAGAAPGLAMHLRRRLEDVVGPEAGAAARLVAGLRRRLRECVADADARRRALASLDLDAVLAALAAGRTDEAEAMADAVLAAASGGAEAPCTR